MSAPRWALASVLPCVRSVLGVLIWKLKVLQGTSTVISCLVAALVFPVAKPVSLHTSIGDALSQCV